MKSFAGIKELYHPGQSSLFGFKGEIDYHEYQPDRFLRNFVHCYWHLHTKKELKKTFSYRVVADGCIDIFFDLANPTDSYVMGFCKAFTEFSLPKTFNYFGIRFYPSMFPQVFKQDASELANCTEVLEAVVPKTAGFIFNNLHQELRVEILVSLMDRHLVELIQQVSFNYDSRFYNALLFILQKKGTVAVESDFNTGLCSRQLRRLFKFYIGETAKTFSGVVRFQNILQAKPTRESLRKNKLFLSAYYDQAHFIRDCKRYYGSTPGKAFPA